MAHYCITCGSTATKREADNPSRTYCDAPCQVAYYDRIETSAVYWVQPGPKKALHRDIFWLQMADLSIYETVAELEVVLQANNDQRRVETVKDWVRNGNVTFLNGIGYTLGDWHKWLNITAMFFDFKRVVVFFNDNSAVEMVELFKRWLDQDHISMWKTNNIIDDSVNSCYDAIIRTGHIPLFLLSLPHFHECEVKHILLIASKYGQLEFVRILLADSRINSDAFVHEALYDASVYGKTEVVKLLLESSRINSDAMYRALEKAVKTKHDNIIRLLINDPRLSQAAIDWAIMLSSMDGYIQGVRLLMYLTSDESLKMIFRSEIRKGQVTMVKLLLDDPRTDKFQSKFIIWASFIQNKPLERDAIIQLLTEAESRRKRQRLEARLK